MIDNEDTIVAISTAMGTGGIGIVRMSGENSFKILDKIFKPKSKKREVKGYSIKYGNILENDETVDEVLVSYFVNPKSYTTEDMCEINTHGGIAIQRKVLELCLKNGARLAEPGEFTKRAFLNGRIDLSQAEAVIDLINSNTELEAKESAAQLEGKLSKQIQEIENKLYDAITAIEVTIDYPEYDIDELEENTVIDSLRLAQSLTEKLISTFDNGKLIKEGIHTVIVGRPNAGKSSLMNTILGEDRAIVSTMEGTTRDTIEEFVNINGVKLKLIDTAGIRETENEIEKIGVDKALNMAEKADLLIGIFDITNFQPKDEELIDYMADKKSIIVLNKIDLIKDNFELEEKIKKINKPIIKLSAKNGEGIDMLYDEIEKMFDLGKIEANDKSIITNERHKRLITEAYDFIKNAIDEITKQIPLDMCSVYIKSGLERLGEIVGENVSEAIISSIFEKFCLGK